MRQQLMPSLLLAALAALAVTAGAAEEPARIEIGADAAAGPVEAGIDFGMARANAAFPISWRLVNRSDRVVVLGDLKTSCPCLSGTSFTARRLAPTEEATVSALWYVGPAHGKQTLRITIPMTAAGEPAAALSIDAAATVTDLIDLDEGARVVALGKFTAETLAGLEIPAVTFQKTAFRAWDEVHVVGNDSFASIAITDREPGTCAISFAAVAPERLAGRPFGVFSDDFTLGFRKAGRELPETVRYRVAGHYAHARYAVSPPQLYWGPMTGEPSQQGAQPQAAQPQAARRATVAGFMPTAVTHQRTTYLYNGMETRGAASPFQVTVDGRGIDVRLATTPVAMPELCDKGCAVYLIEGTDDGDTVRYLLPIFFSIPD